MSGKKIPCEQNGWTSIEGGQCWQKGNVFANLTRTTPDREMVMRFGPREGEMIRVPGRKIWTFSGVDPRESIQIEYTNFQGEQQTYPARLDSLRAVGTHVSLRVPSERERLSLQRTRITNAAQLPAIPTKHELRQITPHLRRGTTRPVYEALQQKFPAFAPPLPSSYEKQVITYHQRRGTTSSRCEELKAKYSPA